MAAVASRYKELQELGAEALSVSVDSHFVHKMWQDNELSKMLEGGVPFPMLSDQTGKIGMVYGVYDEKAGVEMRGRFIIDPDGVIQGIEILTPPVGRNVKELIRQLQAFQHVRNTKGTEATPSGWDQADRRSTPGRILWAKYGRNGRLKMPSHDLAFYKFVVDSVPSGVITVDRNLMVSGLNPWAERLTGYSGEEAVFAHDMESSLSIIGGFVLPLLHKADLSPLRRRGQRLPHN